MRRAAPPQMMRVDPADPGPWARVAQTGRGIGLAAAPEPPGGPHAPDTAVLRPARGVPFATAEAVIVNEGALVLTAAPGVARTLRMPDLATLFDRRPPGLRHVLGAAGANAGLLADDAGWRAVVLPSMGDLAADLGPGPIAIRSDGRQLALVHEGALYEIALPGAATAAREVDGAPTALAFGHDGRLIVAAGGALAGAHAAAGSPVVALAAASAAARALALHDDGTCSLWDTAAVARIAAWPCPSAGAPSVALSPDGTCAAFGTPSGDDPAAWTVRAEDGAPMRRVEGARVIAFDPAGRGMLVGGDWGALWMEPPREVQ